MTAIHQFIPSFQARDAMGAHVVHVQRTLREMGVSSEIYAADIGPDAGATARPYRSYATRRRPEGSTDTWLLYQLSTGSAMASWLLEQPEPKIVNYHNITPASLLTPWEPAVGAEVEAGRRQLARLAAVTELGIAVSSYNEKELVAAGYRATAVVPLFVDFGGPERGRHRGGSGSPAGLGVPERGRHGGSGPPAEDHLTGTRSRGGARWLFVGRLAPNKCQHDLIKALAAYRRLYDPDAELVLVGKPTFSRYAAAVEKFVAATGLGGAVRVEGSVSPAELAAQYRAADVVVCLSEHEGFCAPILEAMAHGVPVVAYAAAAVPETVADAGLVLPDKASPRVAAAVHRVLTDPVLRQTLVARGRQRARDFAPERTAAVLRQVIGDMVGSRSVSSQ